MRVYVALVGNKIQVEPSRHPILMGATFGAELGLKASTVQLPDTLVMPPWIGEFAYEIMNAAVLRRMRKHFKKLIVCSRPGSEPIYTDMPHTFIPHAIKCEGQCVHALPGHTPAPGLVNRYIPDDVAVQRIVDYGPTWPGDYVAYGRRRHEWQGCVVVHARERPHVPARNWPLANWNTLARRLYAAGVDRIVCIGTTGHALAIEGAADARHLALSEQMNILASARLAVGPSSGPMHLASHCKCPHVVWCGGPERFRVAERYKRHWNPFETRVAAHLVPNWRPSIEAVYQWVCTALEKG